MQQERSEILRATAVVALLAIGAIHFLQIVDTLRATPLLGIAYVGLIGATIALAAWLLVANDPRAWVGAGLLSIAVIAGYGFTRMIGTTFDPEDVGNWACMLGLASLFVEASLVAISTYAIASAHAELRFESAIADRRAQATWEQGELVPVSVRNDGPEIRAITTRSPDPRSFISDLDAVRHDTKSSSRRVQ
jgi:hypothetical protein